MELFFYFAGLLNTHPANLHHIDSLGEMQINRAGIQ